MPKHLVSVTGASGRLGVPVVRALQKHFELLLLARDVAKAKKLFPGKKIVEIDLETAGVAEIQAAIKGSWAVVNLAGLVDLVASREKLFSINYEATAKVVKACEREHVPFFVHCSSISVYADSNSEISEDAKLAPTTVYGESKLAAEKFVISSTLNWVVLRPGIIYGPHFQEGFVGLIEQMKKGRAAIIGNGDNRVPLVYEGDVATVFLKCLQLLRRGNKHILRQAFNVVSEKEPTQNQALDLLAKTFILPTLKKHISLPVALTLARLYSIYCALTGKTNRFSPEYVSLLARNRQYDTNKAKKIIKIKCGTSLEKGLGEIKRAWIENRIAN